MKLDGISYTKILITDVGSTTTKSVLFAKKNDFYRLLGVSNSPTTVEKPHSDIKIGLYNSLLQLQEKTGEAILHSSSKANSPIIRKEFCFISTSSAGGGLQIFVVGLTIADSAKTAERTVFGAGGVLLDTIAVNDNKTDLDRILSINNSRPDIILFSGGTDGGAIQGLARIIQSIDLAKPKNKFDKTKKIPLVYCGNQKASRFIKDSLSEYYDVNITKNVRPKPNVEQIEPARNKIHELFMEKVMEYAPGYSSYKKMVSHPITPTPSSVLTSLKISNKKENKNIITIDIGGATTDIFSNINGKFYRTVSANYGMSYSIANSTKDYTVEKLLESLPFEIEKSYLQNYIANKMLFPTYIPKNDTQIAIEHAVARSVIKMSLEQHIKMYFNIKQIGLLERVKNRKFRKFQNAMYYDNQLKKKMFTISDINAVIVAGGVFTGIKKPLSVIAITADGFKLRGVTEIKKDKNFLSPHLGKLGEINEELASRLLKEECYETIGIYLKPLKFNNNLINKKFNFTITYQNGSIVSKSILIGDFFYLENSEKVLVKVFSRKGIEFKEEDSNFEFFLETNLLIDLTRDYSELLKKIHKLEKDCFDFRTNDLKQDFSCFRKTMDYSKNNILVMRSLPLPGVFLVQVGTKVSPNTVLAENIFQPTRHYVINLYQFREKLSLEDFSDGLLVKKGDQVKKNQLIFCCPKQKSYRRECHVNGVVTYIDFFDGVIFIKEKLEYSFSPTVIEVAKLLKLKKGSFKSSLKKKLNDYVLQGDPLAITGHLGNKNILFSPTTGTITNIDCSKETLTIQYEDKPFLLYSGIKGTVKEIIDSKEALINFEGIQLKGIIGFGTEIFGKFSVIKSITQISSQTLHTKILINPLPTNYDDILLYQKIGIKCLITPSIEYSDLKKFLKKDIGVALTGNEKIPFSLVLTEGFGNIKMAKNILDIYVFNQEKTIFVRPYTQIRAGVKRPEIYISDC